VAVALAVAALGACTAGGTATGTASDGKTMPVGGSTAPPLPPGKYQTLPQPCSAVSLDALRKLVPGAKDYAGTEALTYDTDRRVGCGWQGTTADGATRSLSVDFERVVSYDPGVSDEVQAESEFDQRAAAASIPPPVSGTPTATATTPAATTPTPTSTGTAGAAGTAAGTTPTGNASGPPAAGGSGAMGADTSAGDPALAPRRLTGIGNEAFVNDVLKTPATGPRRVVTLVFRTANVVVSVTYSGAEPRGAQPAPSADLQKGAEQVATQLEHKVER
jgi:hypothetical protein